MNIFRQLQKLNLPRGEYVVVGGGALSARGIREHQDIDLLVTPKLYEKLLKDGWEQAQSKPNLKVIHFEEFEASPAMISVGEYRPPIQDVIDRAEIIKGFPFQGLNDLIEFKLALGREKDIADIEIIKEYQGR